MSLGRVQHTQMSVVGLEGRDLNTANLGSRKIGQATTSQMEVQSGGCGAKGPSGEQVQYLDLS